MKVAVIGIGVISHAHINSIITSGQQLVALCDVDASRCENANKKYGISAKIYTDYLQMLDEVRPDSVHVCTPHYLHAEMICACLQRNINVLSEKPMAISYEQLSQIEQAVKTSSATLGVCHQRRFETSMGCLKEVFEKEDVLGANGNLCWQRDVAYYESGAWRGKWATEGGGVAINQALHTLDLLLWICGMPVSVVAHKSNDTLQGVIEVEDSVSAIYTLENGKKFVFNATNGSSHSLPVNITVAGSKTLAVVVDENVLLNGVYAKKEEIAPLYGKVEWGVGHLKLIQKYYECLKKGEKFPIDFYEGQKVIKLILALYESDGKEVEIK